METKPVSGRVFGPNSVAVWSVIGGVSTLLALIVARPGRDRGHRPAGGMGHPAGAGQRKHRAAHRATAGLVIGGGIGVVAVTALAWGLAVRAATPAGLADHYGILATPFLPSWLATIALMAAATALAATAALGVRTAPSPAR